MNDVNQMIKYLDKEFFNFEYMDLEERKENISDILDALENSDVAFEYLEDIEVDMDGRSTHQLIIDNNRKKYYICSETYNFLKGE